MATEMFEHALGRTYQPFHRVDDVGDDDPAVIALLECLAPYHERVVAAVIPRLLTQRMSAFLRRHSYAVFQHGVTHLNRTEEGYPDEFPSYLHRRDVESSLVEGRRRIEDSLGYTPLGYVPPWNRTAQQTLEVLGELGFQVLSGHARFTYVTAMTPLHVMLDTAASYDPLRPLRAASIVRDYERLLPISRRASIGIMYHATRLARPSVRSLVAAALRIEALASNIEVRTCQG